MEDCSSVCVHSWATRPFECDEWAADMGQRGWAGHGSLWTKAVTVQKDTPLSHSSVSSDMKKYNLRSKYYKLCISSVSAVITDEI